MKRLTIRVAACTETLSLMIALAWADGRLDDREKAGVKGAAEVLNLPKELRSRLDSALEKAPAIADLGLEDLTARERAFAFVAVAWMAGVDAVIDPKERVMMDNIAARLGITGERREKLTEISKKLEPVPDGGTGWADQVMTLFKAIPPELEETIDEFEVAFE